MELDPKDARAWRNLGDARLLQENYAGAEEAYQLAVKLDPKDARAWTNLGGTLFNQENYAGAEEAFRKIITIEKDSPTVWYFLGIACSYQWKLKESYNALLKGIALDPHDIDFYTSLVEIHVLSHGALGALKLFDKSLKIKKIKPYLRCALHLLRAIVLTSDENRPAALQAMKKVRLSNSLMLNNGCSPPEFARASSMRFSRANSMAATTAPRAMSQGAGERPNGLNEIPKRAKGRRARNQPYRPPSIEPRITEATATKVRAVPPQSTWAPSILSVSFMERAKKRR